jgi:hypothetical protein
MTPLGWKGKAILKQNDEGERTAMVRFLPCTLKGLHRSPRIITDAHAMNRPGVFTAADVSCLVIPDGCLGLPTLAALEQGIPVGGGEKAGAGQGL